MNASSLIKLSLVIALMFSLSGCGLMVAAGVGAAAGYEGAKKGYKVQSPVTKQKTKDSG